MTIGEIQTPHASANLSQEMHAFIADLFPICRSITGEGLRETLRRIGTHIPLTIHEVPTGTAVFDWIVPKEWNIRDAYVKDSAGNKVIDFSESNLHVLNYSIPVRATVSYDELKTHLFTLPDRPGWIPYRTSYYDERWGFCLSHDQMRLLRDGKYEVCIDASLQPGSLSYGEYFIPGSTSDEVLISCHTCHPSMGNDNLSGVALATFLARYLTPLALRYSYRFLFIPGTIGSITWLSLNEVRVGNIKHGLVLACVGDHGKSTYKKSRRGNAEIDRAVVHVLEHSGQDYQVLEFSPYGYDERQFCSPGFNLPVGCLMRTPYGEFPEYHTSADDLSFVHPVSLGDSFAKCLTIFQLLEDNRAYINQNAKCEPQLGKRGLYGAVGGDRHDGKALQMALLWVLNLSDGHHTLLDIAERAGLDFGIVRAAANLLSEHALLRPIDGGSA